MQRSLLLFVLFATNILAMVAAVPEVVYFHSDDFDGPEETAFRTVERDSMGITVTYDFDIATFEHDDVYAGTFWCQLEGFGQTTESGSPALSRRIDIFDVPANTLRPHLMLVSYEYTDLDFTLTPARQDLFDSEDIRYSKANVMPIKSSVFGSASTIVTDFNFTCEPNRGVYEVQVKPVQFDLATSKTRIYHKIQYRIQYEFPSESSSASDAQDESAASEQEETAAIMDDDMEYSIEGITLGNNNNSWAKISFLLENPKNYLIISCNKYIAAVERFADLKRKYGMNTYISLRDTWSKEIIQDSINHYANIDPNLEYVLMFGSNTDVPSQNKTISNQFVLTDFPYATVHDATTGNPYQRFYMGRIPVRNIDEANYVVDKIIDYSLYPPEDDEFYNTGTNIAYFQGNGNKYQEARGYLQCSEQIKQYLDTLGYNVQRVYSADTGTPTYFKSGDPLPLDLLPNNYNWSKSPGDVANAINNGGFYVFHRDHGNLDGWSWPEFKNAHLGLLKNTDRLPVVFSINCLTGKFDYTECFAERLLKMNNLGAAGVIAATNVTYTTSNNVLAPGIFKCIFGGEGPVHFKSELPAPLNANKSVENTELGRMLESGLIWMKEQYPGNFNYQSAVYHVFGDPSMMMWTETPSRINNYECKVVYETESYTPEYTDIPLTRKVFNGYKIKLKQEGYVAVLDTLTKTTKLFKGREGIISDIKFNRHKIYAYRPNGILTPITTNEMIQDSNPVEIERHYFKLYPNPASSTCYVECKMPAIYIRANIFVANIATGTVVKRFLNVENNTTVEIDVSDMPNGEYIVKMLVGNGLIPSINGGTEKLIVNH